MELYEEHIIVMMTIATLQHLFNFLRRIKQYLLDFELNRKCHAVLDVDIAYELPMDDVTDEITIAYPSHLNETI